MGKNSLSETEGLTKSKMPKGRASVTQAFGESWEEERVLHTEKDIRYVGINVPPLLLRDFRQEPLITTNLIYRFSNEIVHGVSQRQKTTHKTARVLRKEFSGLCLDQQ